MALLGAMAAAPARADDPTEPSEVAMTFAGLFSDRHLSGMLSRIGARTPQMITLGQAGGRLTERDFNAEIDTAVAKYGLLWQRNMALSWTGLLDDDAIASLIDQGAESPHQARYLALRGEAGEAMQGLSEDLFRQILGEVVANTVTALQVESPAPTQ